MLQEVELSIFLCTPWFIPRSGLTITIHRSIIFPAFVTTTPIGTTTLTLQPNCESLENIYITTSPTDGNTIYFIEFTNNATVGGIYIGEVVFRDEICKFMSVWRTFVVKVLYSQKMTNKIFHQQFT